MVEAAVKAALHKHALVRCTYDHVSTDTLLYYMRYSVSLLGHDSDVILPGASFHGPSYQVILTVTLLVATIDAQWEGMGDVGSARYEPALLPPCPTIRVLSYSSW